MPCRFASSGTVATSRSASRAILALNAASNFLRDLVISVLRRLRQSRTLHTLTFGPISGVHFKLLGVQQLCWTYRFGVELTGRFTVGLFRGVFAKEFATDRYRRLIAKRWFDAFLPDEAVSKAFHRRRRWIRSCTIAPCATKQGRSSRDSTLLQLADNALSDFAHGVNRTDHLLFTYNDVVEQAFKLRRHARID